MTDDEHLLIGYLLDAVDQYIKIQDKRFVGDEEEKAIREYLIKARVAVADHLTEQEIGDGERNFLEAS